MAFTSTQLDGAAGETIECTAEKAVRDDVQDSWGLTGPWTTWLQE